MPGGGRCRARRRHRIIPSDEVGVLAETPGQGLRQEPPPRVDPQLAALDMLTVEHGMRAVLAAPLDPVGLVVVGDVDDSVGHAKKAELAGLVVARGKSLAILLHPESHRGAVRHVLITADVAQGAAVGQFIEQPLGELMGVERDATAPGRAADFPGAPVAGRKPVSIRADPELHRARGRHALVQTEIAQRTPLRQRLQNPLGDLLGIDGGGAAPGAADLPGSGEACREAVAVSLQPALNGAVGRDALVATEIVQRPAARDLAQDPLGKFLRVERRRPVGDGAGGRSLPVVSALACGRSFDSAGHGGCHGGTSLQGLRPHTGRAAMPRAPSNAAARPTPEPARMAAADRSGAKSSG